MVDKNNSIYTHVRSSLMRRLLVMFFRLLYHSMSWTYDMVASAVSLGRWNSWVLAIAGLIQGPRVLELGFGPGHLQVHLHRAGLAVFGLDESAQMNRQAARRLTRLGYHPRLSRGLAQGLPYSSGVFNTVVATFPTPYIIDPKTLREILRVLMPEGRLVVLTAAWITGKSLPERALSSLFHATGQVPPEDIELTRFTEAYTQAGFQASLRFINQKKSRLLVILAAKPRIPHQ